MHYLSGNPVDTFVSHLKKIASDYSEDEKVRVAIWQLLRQPPSDQFCGFLAQFSEFEQSVMCMLMLGLSVGEISKIKGISEVRIRQTVSTIRYNDSWEQLHGTKEKPNG